MARWSDAAIAAALGLVACLTRWLHRGHALFSWDSGLLASGVVEYDFAAGHPHPPYYPLAIAMAKVAAWGSDPVAGVVTIAVVGSGVMAAFTYLAARGVVGVGASLFAGAIVVLSPTSLFNGVAPLTYSLEGASSAVVAWAAWRCRTRPDAWRAAALAVATSAAVGIRPSSLFLVAPLAVWGVWGAWRAMGKAVVVGAGATLAWAVPAMVAGGGLDRFLAGTAYQSSNFVFAHTVVHDGWSVVPRYASRLASYMPWELPFLAALALLGGVTALAWWRNRPSAPAGSFLATWILPSLAFYILVYDGWPVYPSGYVLPLLPALAVAAAILVRCVVVGLWSSGAALPARTVALAVVAATCLAPGAWAADWEQAVSGQREADAWAALLPSLRETYPANETVIVTYYGWFWVKFGLPEYLAWGTHPYSGPDGRVYVQIIEHQNGQESPPAYANALEGPGDDPLHPFPTWAKHVVMVYAPPTRGEVVAFKDGIAVDRLTLASGLRVDVVDVTGVPTLEQALRWFDAEGRPLPG